MCDPILGLGPSVHAGQTGDRGPEQTSGMFTEWWLVAVAVVAELGPAQQKAAGEQQGAKGQHGRQPSHPHHSQHAAPVPRKRTGECAVEVRQQRP